MIKVLIYKVLHRLASSGPYISEKVTSIFVPELQQEKISLIISSLQIIELYFCEHKLSQVSAIAYKSQPKEIVSQLNYVNNFSSFSTPLSQRHRFRSDDASRFIMSLGSLW